MLPPMDRPSSVVCELVRWYNDSQCKDASMYKNTERIDKASELAQWERKDGENVSLRVEVEL